MGKKKLICGVGINDLCSESRINGKRSIAYHCWNDMIRRCYGDQTKYPSYVGCTVCSEWHLYSNFKKWFEANYLEGYHLDKDILFEGNKTYSSETCLFVPVYLNILLVSRGNYRGDLPIGIVSSSPDTKTGKKSTTYRAYCSNGKGKRLTKTFKTISDATSWYSSTKKNIVAEQVQRALDEGAIDQRIANALLSREFG